jgi:glycerophosphoryl diester phosphodiesterase
MSDLAWLVERPIAHRGYHDLNKTRWENTLSAFDAAARKGYAIECDVHLSRDGVPVVFHDSEMKRLTGLEGFVFDRTADELAACRIGDTQDAVPTLGQVFDLVAGRVPLVIELKGTKGKDEELVGKVAGALARYSGKTAIMSFDHRLIRRFESQARGIPGGLTACGTSDSDLESHFSMLAHNISFISYGVLDLPNRFVGFVREHLAMPVITWTVRDQRTVERTFAHADQMTFEGFEPPVELNRVSAGLAR